MVGKALYTFKIYRSTMPRKTIIPEDKLREAAELCEKGELTNESATDWLEKQGFPKVSHTAIQRARTKFRPFIRTERRIEVSRRPSLDELPEQVTRELVRLEDIISTYHEFTLDMKRQLPPYSETDDPEMKYKWNLLRSEIRKNFEGEVKAICEKTRLMVERRTIIQSIRVGDLGNTEDRYRNGYIDGMSDAKTEFLKICKECKGTAAPIIEASFTLPEKDKEGDTVSPTPQAPSETPIPPKQPARA